MSARWSGTEGAGPGRGWKKGSAPGPAAGAELQQLRGVVQHRGVPPLVERVLEPHGPEVQQDEVVVPLLQIRRDVREVERERVRGLRILELEPVERRAVRPAVAHVVVVLAQVPPQTFAGPDAGPGGTRETGAERPGPVQSGERVAGFLRWGLGREATD